MSLLSGGKELSMLNRSNPSLGSLFERVIAAINHKSTQDGVDPVGQAVAPPSPQSVNVTVTGEMAHVRITDNNPTNRQRNYFTETYTDSQYSQLVHVQDHGASRDATIVLPTNNAEGTMQAFYMRSYSQTLGSPPSAPIAYPTYITMAGATNGTVPQSSGSGTAPTSGAVPAQGYGAYPTRRATGKIRTI